MFQSFSGCKVSTAKALTAKNANKFSWLFIRLQDL